MKKTIYEVIAVFGNKPAGRVCYGATEDQARKRARAKTRMSLRVKRVVMGSAELAELAVARDSVLD
jgi:hypothetical protein